MLIGYLRDLIQYEATDFKNHRQNPLSRGRELTILFMFVCR